MYNFITGYYRDLSLEWDPNDDSPHLQKYPAQEHIEDCPVGYSITERFVNRGYDYGGITCSMCGYAIHLSCIGSDLGDSVFVCRSCSFRDLHGYFPEDK